MITSHTTDMGLDGHPSRTNQEIAFCSFLLERRVTPASETEMVTTGPANIHLYSVGHPLVYGTLQSLKPKGDAYLQREKHKQLKKCGWQLLQYQAASHNRPLCQTS